MHLLESLPTVIGTAAIAPALFILWLVVAAGERPGPPMKIWTAFVLGAASISLLGLVRAPFVRSHCYPQRSLAVAGAACGVRRRAAGRGREDPRHRGGGLDAPRSSADPMDTVVYGAAAGLGFAAYENLAYLVQHAEMWRSLAILRSVLTVPFHGALGVIAGAYLAIARSGTALGAHRHHRDWARISSWILLVAGPVGLHAAFDFPLLMLQQPSTMSSALRIWLGVASILIGFSSIGFAMRLVRRVARHHAPRTDLDRERFSQLRRMWALLVAGGGAGFIGLSFVLSSVRHWILNPDHNVALVLVPIGLVAIVLGAALLIVTTAIYFLGRNRMRTTAEGFSSASGGS